MKRTFLVGCVLVLMSAFIQRPDDGIAITSSGFNFHFRFPTGTKVIHNGRDYFEALYIWGKNESNNTMHGEVIMKIFPLDPTLLQSKVPAISVRMDERWKVHINDRKAKIIRTQDSLARLEYGGLYIVHTYIIKSENQELQETFRAHDIICKDKIISISVSVSNKDANFIPNLEKQTSERVLGYTWNFQKTAVSSLNANVTLYPSLNWKNGDDQDIIITPFVKGKSDFDWTMTIKRLNNKKKPIKDLTSKYAAEGYKMTREQVIDYGKFVLESDRKKEIEYQFQHSKTGKKFRVYYLEGKSPFNECYTITTDGYPDGIRISPLN